MLSAQVENCFFRAKNRKTRKRQHAPCCKCQLLSGQRLESRSNECFLCCCPRIQQLPSVQRSQAGRGQPVSPFSQPPAQDTPFSGPSFMLPFGCFSCHCSPMHRGLTGSWAVFLSLLHFALFNLDGNLGDQHR